MLASSAVPSLIYFSGLDDDFIKVQEEVQQVLEGLGAGAGPSGLNARPFTLVPAKGQYFDPTHVYVSRQRVAYVRPAPAT